MSLLSVRRPAGRRCSQRLPLAIGLARRAAQLAAVGNALCLAGGCAPRHLVQESLAPDEAALQAAWSSSAFAIEPFVYYRIRFRTKTPVRAGWSIAYRTDSGEELTGDHYSSVEPSADWLEQTSFFKGKPDAPTARVRFHPVAGGPLHLESVTVTHVSRRQVAAWSDALYRTLPPVSATWPAQAGARIPRALARLRNGETLRIVLLGDSIANDTGNSPFDVLIERRFPGARVEVVTSVKGATGCWYYRHESRIEPYVLAYRPDLVIIAGISHHWDPESIGEVIDQIRARSDAEIMVMTGAVAPMTREREQAGKLFRTSPAQAARRITAFQKDLETLVHDRQVEWFPMRTAWDDYVDASGRPAADFMRDAVHANDRGREVLARLIDSYFARCAVSP